MAVSCDQTVSLFFSAKEPARKALLFAVRSRLGTWRRFCKVHRFVGSRLGSVCFGVIRFSGVLFKSQSVLAPHPFSDSFFPPPRFAPLYVQFRRRLEPSFFLAAFFSPDVSESVVPSKREVLAGAVHPQVFERGPSFFLSDSANSVPNAFSLPRLFLPV